VREHGRETTTLERETARRPVATGHQHQFLIDRGHVDRLPSRRKPGLEFHMSAIVLIGAQWGDEGKGKATDLLGG
jgi:hypothetical protein